MRFDEEREERRRPPNYLARRNQWRLLMLVASLMLVLVLMDRARDPKNYEWLFRLSQNDNAAAQSNADTDADSDAVKNLPAADRNSHDATSSTDVSSAPRDTTDDTRLQTAVDDAWQFVLVKLDTSSFNAVADTLLAGRSQRELDPPRRQRLRQAADDMERLLADYIDHARSELQSRPTEPANTELWQQVLEQLQHQTSLTVAALRVVASADSADVDVQQFTSLQASLDQVALTRVVDDTVFHANDSAAWFRLLEQLRDSPPDFTAAQDVGFLEMLQQPDEYRGKLVRVRGDARELRQVSVRDNAASIEHYYIIWLKPDDANSPLPIYALQLPDQFPGRDQLQTDGPAVPLKDVPLEVAGYFFKRWAYRAQQSVEVAPLLLARAPALITEDTSTGEARLPHPLVLVAAAALIAAVCVTLVKRRSQGDDPRQQLPDHVKISPPGPGSE